MLHHKRKLQAMKNSAFFAVVFSVLFLSCQKDISSSNQKIELKYGAASEEMLNGDSIVLDSVLEDSRCPENATCIWEGNAKLRFIYRTKDKLNESFVLNTYMGYRKDTLIKGFRIKLVKVSPYPRLDEDILQTDYRAELEIIKE